MCTYVGRGNDVVSFILNNSSLKIAFYSINCSGTAMRATRVKVVTPSYHSALAALENSWTVMRVGKYDLVFFFLHCLSRIVDWTDDGDGFG